MECPAECVDSQTCVCRVCSPGLFLGREDWPEGAEIVTVLRFACWCIERGVVNDG